MYIKILTEKTNGDEKSKKKKKEEKRLYRQKFQVTGRARTGLQRQKFQIWLKRVKS
jgi:hypothetical protein